MQVRLDARGAGSSTLQQGGIRRDIAPGNNQLRESPNATGRPVRYAGPNPSSQQAPEGGGKTDAEGRDQARDQASKRSASIQSSQSAATNSTAGSKNLRGAQLQMQAQGYAGWQPLAQDGKNPTTLDELARNASVDRRMQRKTPPPQQQSSYRGQGSPPSRIASGQQASARAYGLGHASGSSSMPHGDIGTVVQDQPEATLKDLMGMAPSPPASEAASSAAISQAFTASTGVARVANADVEIMTIEDRIRRLENSLDERLIKTHSEAMNANITLCKASEDRFSHKLEALRRELQEEVMRTVQQAVGTSSQPAQRGTFQGADVEALRTGLLSEMHEAVGQEFGNLRRELAVRGVPVLAGLPPMAELEAAMPQGAQGQGQSKRTGIAGLVGVISDCVIEKVKEDQCIRNVSEQHEQLKEAIKELRAIPGALSEDGKARQPEYENLHNMVKEMMKITYALAKELGAEREQRSREFTEAGQRLEMMEQFIGGASPSDSSQAPPERQRERSVSGPRQALSANSPPLRANSMPKRVTGAPFTASSAVCDDKGSSLERVMGGLQRLVNQDDGKPKMSPRNSSAPRQPFDLPQALSQIKNSPNAAPASPQHEFRQRASSTHSQHSQASDDGGNDWSSEVRALRSRLENIFQIGGSAGPDALGTGSTGLSGTVGSLPTVQETNVEPTQQ